MSVESERFLPSESPSVFKVRVFSEGTECDELVYKELLEVTLSTKGKYVRSIAAYGVAVEGSNREPSAEGVRQMSLKVLAKVMGWQEQVDVPRRGGGVVSLFRDADGEILPWNLIVFWEATGVPKTVGAP
ncbi:MAG TPA: hypothetical protein P5234_16415 [Thermoanaerobaculaceae bacterium]|nr:hypothetical protein [Thermoanaerobaculaceae bacterium]